MSNVQEISSSGTREPAIKHSDQRFLNGVQLLTNLQVSSESRTLQDALLLKLMVEAINFPNSIALVLQPNLFVLETIPDIRLKALLASRSAVRNFRRIHN